jgi:hypothetical protein
MNGILLQHFIVWVRSAILSSFRPVASLRAGATHHHNPDDPRNSADRREPGPKPVVAMAPPVRPPVIPSVAGRPATIRPRGIAQGLASISGRFRVDYGTSHHQISCYGFHDWLRSSPFSPSCRLRRPQAGAAPVKPDQGARRNHPQVRHIETSQRNHPKRRGGEVAHNRCGRFLRRFGRNHPAAAEATSLASPFRS